MKRVAYIFTAYALALSLMLVVLPPMASAGSVTSSSITCGGTACGTYYSVQLNISCSWLNSASSCTGSDTVTPPSTGSDSVYVSQVVGSGTPGVCQATGQSFLNSGNIFGISFSGYGGSGNITGTKSANTGTDTVSVSGGCIGGGGGVNGAYHITDCHSGYTATGDGTCTSNCTINSFTNNNGTLTWSITGSIPASSVQLTQSGLSPATLSPNPVNLGSLSGYVAVPLGATYTLSSTAASCSSAVVVSAPGASLGATWSDGTTSKTINNATPNSQIQLPINFSNNGPAGSEVNLPTNCLSINTNPASFLYNNVDSASCTAGIY